MSTRSKDLIIKQNKEITKGVFELIIEGDDFSDCKHGQFVNIKILTATLRRPFSITLIEKDALTIVYRVVGDGTRELASLQSGSKLNVLYPLGTGFERPINKEMKVMMIGGGIGVTPLYGWYKLLCEEGYNVEVLLGFKKPEEDIYVDRFNPEHVIYDSIDGNIINGINKKDIKFDYYYSCGPMGLLKALAKNYPEGQLLLEERMGCGFGACMGCSYKISEEDYKRVCVEGPMFYAKEVCYEG